MSDGREAGGTDGGDGGDGIDGRPAGTMRGRIPGSRLRVWLLLKADRWLFAGVLLALIFLALLAVGRFEPGPFTAALGEEDPVETFFQAMVTAIVTGVTLVVSINQLVLSQELGPVGDQRSRMRGAMDFRADVESHLDDAVSPADPATFLHALLEAVQDDASALESALGPPADGGPTGDLTSFARAVASDASDVKSQVEGATFGTFQVVHAGLNFNYSSKIYDGRRLRSTHADALSDEADAALDDVLESLELFAPAREHFKTLYFQWELVNLSQEMLYSAVPALATAAVMILFFSPAAGLPGSTLGVANVVWLVAVAAIVTIAPFVLLVAYILRIATVAKRTLAIGPFVLRGEG